MQTVAADDLQQFPARHSAPENIYCRITMFPSRCELNAERQSLT